VKADETATRVEALEALLVEKGIVEPGRSPNSGSVVQKRR